VTHVRSLHIYPVKSCRGIDVDQAVVVERGLRHDRRWMIVDPDGVFLSQRNHPAMARIRPRLTADTLVLETAGHPPLEVPLTSDPQGSRRVRVWRDACTATSEGPGAADWFSSVLGASCELVRQRDDDLRQIDPDHAETGEGVSFADGFPLLLVSQSSVDELNRRLAEPVAADRFRANIVIEGCEAHAEDGWTALEIGGVSFRVAKPCARCVVITTDQTTGDRSPEPLRTLASYRTVGGEVLFGQNLVQRGSGRIRVGDVVTAYPRT
jgi:uncharacterized protein YcbX